MRINCWRFIDQCSGTQPIHPFNVYQNVLIHGYWPLNDPLRPGLIAAEFTHMTVDQFAIAYTYRNRISPEFVQSNQGHRFGQNMSPKIDKVRNSFPKFQKKSQMT